MLLATNCEQNCIDAPSGPVLPCHPTTQRCNAAHHHAATFSPANEALPVTVPFAGHAFLALTWPSALSWLSILSLPSVAADRLAPAKSVDANCRCHRVQWSRPSSARASRSSSNAGSELLVVLPLENYIAAVVGGLPPPAPAIQGQACLSTSQATDSSCLLGKQPMHSKDLRQISTHNNRFRFPSRETHHDPAVLSIWSLFCSDPSPHTALGSSAQTFVLRGVPVMRPQFFLPLSKCCRSQILRCSQTARRTPPP